MNTQTPVLPTDPQLDQLAGQFEHWRQNRSHPSERIPQAFGEHEKPGACPPAQIARPGTALKRSSTEAGYPS